VPQAQQNPTQLSMMGTLGFYEGSGVGPLYSTPVR
jgi:hypothetical protein